MQNILLTSLTPLQNVDEIKNWDNRPFTGVWPGTKRNRSTEIKKTIKKKRVRTIYTTEQLRALEQSFLKHKYITSEHRQEISKLLNIEEKCIKIWFQNRRMKEKRESSESSSDISNERIVGETCQYEVPPLYRNDEQIQTPDENSYVPTNSMPLYNDNNVYPTEYYPCTGNNYFNYYQYQEEYPSYSIYWSSNNVDYSYLPNQG